MPLNGIDGKYLTRWDGMGGVRQVSDSMLCSL